MEPWLQLLTNSMYKYCQKSEYFILSFVAVQLGQSALQIAINKGHQDMVKLFLQVYRSSEKTASHMHGCMGLAEGYPHRPLAKYLPSEFPTWRKKVRCHKLSTE